MVTDTVVEPEPSKNSTVVEEDSESLEEPVIRHKTSGKRSLRDTSLEDDDDESPPSSPGISRLLGLLQLTVTENGLSQVPSVADCSRMICTRFTRLGFVFDAFSIFTGLDLTQRNLSATSLSTIIIRIRFRSKYFLLIHKLSDASFHDQVYFSKALSTNYCFYPASAKEIASIRDDEKAVYY